MLVEGVVTDVRNQFVAACWREREGLGWSGTIAWALPIVQGRDVARAVMRFVISASCCRSFIFTPALSAPAVAPFVMLLIASTNAARALMTRSAWLTVGRVMLLC